MMDEKYSHLPQGAIDLIEVIGEEDAFAIMRHYGGRRLYIPRRYSNERVLASVISDKGFRTLCYQWGGICLEHVPSIKRHEQMLRNRKIFQESESGLSLTNLSKKYNLSVRTIIQVLKAARKQQQQDNET